jgi:hypothetical protein
MIDAPLPLFCDLPEKTAMPGVQVFIILEAGTLYSLLMLNSDMSQASLRSLFVYCGSVPSVQPIKSLYRLIH